MIANFVFRLDSSVFDRLITAQNKRYSIILIISILFISPFWRTSITFDNAIMLYQRTPSLWFVGCTWLVIVLAILQRRLDKRAIISNGSALLVSAAVWGLAHDLTPWWTQALSSIQFDAIISEKIVFCSMLWFIYLGGFIVCWFIESPRIPWEYLVWNLGWY
jgi:hypothetical protein